MKKVMQREIGPVALLVLLAFAGFLVFVAVKRRHEAAEEHLSVEKVEAEAAYVGFRVENAVVHDVFAAAALLIVGALFAFAAVTAVEASLRARLDEHEEDEAFPPVNESSTSGRTESTPSTNQETTRGHSGL
jgi:TRAP-type C4-dicarboxylate transport system permease small subunit